MAKRTTAARPIPKPIAAYYATLKEFEHQYALHEGAVNSGFGRDAVDQGPRGDLA